jgi:hypothetical protein
MTCVKELQTAMNGFEKSSRFNPVARSRLLWGALSHPAFIVSLFIWQVPPQQGLLKTWR